SDNQASYAGLASYAGGIYCQEGSNATISNCTIVGNYGDRTGGVMFFGSSPTMNNCYLIGNSSYDYAGGISCVSGANATINNCVIKGNSSTYSYAGGGIFCNNSNPIINNCTITKNSGYRGGGLYCFRNTAPIMLRNSIVWDNTANIGPQIALTSGSYPSAITVMYCDVDGGSAGVSVATSCTLNWGEGNINANPLFIDPTNDDYHLLPSSPCIDSGDPSSDWNNEPMPNGARINMGAYGNTSEATCSRAGLQFAGFRIIGDPSRAGRTTFVYVLSLSLTNTTDSDMTDVHVKLIDADDQVINVVDEDILFSVIAAQSTVDSDSFGDYFTIEVDRSELITEGRLTWQVDYSSAAGNGTQMMSANLPAEEDLQVTGDITGDKRVDFEDFAKLTRYWLQNAPSANIVGDDIIDIQDLAVLAEHWLEHVSP
ncbi:MAG: right-handed parallel beta-helix repeat-containing protein, partial [Deltaproteobacteria bacterium]|nr:right-handed parallel beta-helix repeat-containing protein [Deltaproteobacteria bacterium]